MRGHSILPDAPKRWRPKTRAAALAALEDSRRYAARLETAARQQEAREQELRAELAKLHAGAVSGQNEVNNAKERLARAEQKKNEKVKENYKRKRQAERLVDRLKRTEREVTRKEKALSQARADLAALRCLHEQQAAEQASNLAHSQAEVAELSRSRNELNAKVNKLAETTGQLEQRASDAEQKVKQGEDALENERKQTEEAKRGRDESQSMLGLLQRRLESEQERRTAAEQRIEQLIKAQASSVPTHPPTALHTSPGGELSQYRDFASMLAYDPFTDDLFKLMMREVIVSARYSDYQERPMERVTARRRDTAQTVEAQAFAAMMALRWRLIDHPHLRQASITSWARLGVSMVQRDERYAMTLIQERMAEMQTRMATKG